MSRPFPAIRHLPFLAPLVAISGSEGNAENPKRSLSAPTRRWSVSTQRSRPYRSIPRSEARRLRSTRECLRGSVRPAGLRRTFARPVFETVASRAGDAAIVLDAMRRDAAYEVEKGDGLSGEAAVPRVVALGLRGRVLVAAKQVERFGPIHRTASARRPTTRRRGQSIARRRLSERWAATAGRHSVAAYSMRRPV